MESIDIKGTINSIVRLKEAGDMKNSLVEAKDLALRHPKSLDAALLLANILYTVAVGAGGVATGSEKESHLRGARDALLRAKSLAPNNPSIALALADVLLKLSMYMEAEVELQRAVTMDVEAAEKSSHDSARSDRKLSYQRITNRLVTHEVERILNLAKIAGGKLKPLAVKEANNLAQRFPGSARACLFGPFMEMEFLRSNAREHKHPGWSEGVPHLLCSALAAAIEFPNSTAVALFLARLLFVSGKHVDAEDECHRALKLNKPTDPEDECIPPGSITGENLRSRFSSVAGEFHHLLDEILQSAELYWESCLTAQSRRKFMSVRLDELQKECTKVDPSLVFNVSSACTFFRETSSWRFWMCPLCNVKTKKYSTSGSLLKHMCKNHRRSVLPSLEKIVDSTLKLENNDALIEDIFLVKDSGNHDAIFFKERTGIFRLLFSEAIRGEEANAFNVDQQDKFNTGVKLLGNIKEKMANLPSTNSAAHESCKMQDQIRDLWLQFLQCTTIDNGKSLLTLARSSLWRELKKCMAGNLKAAYENISADKIESTFSPWNAAGEHTENKEVPYPTGETAGLSEIGQIPSSNSQGIQLVDIILKTLWCMEDLVDKVIKTEPVCSKHDHCGPCVCVIVHNIFSLWEKREDHLKQLFSLGKALCRSLEDDNFFDERQDQMKHASDITLAILDGLHLSDVFLHIGIIVDTMRPEKRAFVCKYHDPIDLKLIMPMGCGCQTCSAEKLCTDPNKVEHGCKQCASAAVKEPAYPFIVMHWSAEMEVQPSLSEIWDDALQPIMTFQYNHGTRFYSLVAMICYLEGRPVGIVRSESGWLMYDESRAITRCEDPWEGLLAMGRNCKPAVLLYEVIK